MPVEVVEKATPGTIRGALDNASPSNLRSLKLLARDLVADESDDIDAICEALP